MSKNILVASYYFPPYPGIGGRRMAKFCKYMIQKGYTVHVINVENPYAENSQWLEDINLPGINVYSLPLRYPKALMMDSDTQKKKRSFLKRIQYKLNYWFYSLIQKKRVFDPTFLWEKQFTVLAEELIKKFQINNFIVSVSPHYYALYAARLKRSFPDLNLIIDFRDPWLTLRDFGMQVMTAQQKENENIIVSEIINNADYLISPSRFALAEFEKFSSEYGNYIEVPHAYDWDDIKAFKEIAPAIKSDRTRFIYPGTLYTDILPSLLKLNEVLNYLRINYNSIYLQLEFNFYVNESAYSEHFKDHACVNFHRPVGKEIFEKVSGSDIVLILYAEHNKDYRTTKFYEFLPFEKKYLYIGPQGDTFNFIRKYQLGSSFTETTDVELLAEYFLQVSRNELQYKPLLEYKDFSFKTQTDRLISLFK